MKKEKRVWKFFSWNTLVVLVLSCVLNTFVWIAFHGVPVTKIPKKENIKMITITYNSTEKIEIADEANIELLVKSAGLLNHQLFGKKEEGTPVVTLTYETKNGETTTIEANGTTVWQNGKPHSLKEKDSFVNIIEGLFF